MLHDKGFNRFVLIVEDNPSDDMITRFVVEDLEMIPVSVSDGYAALEAIEKQRFAAFIVDLQMPLFSGIDLLHRMKLNKSLKGIPVIITSSRNEQKDVKQAINLGAIDYLIKPIDPLVLKAKLENALKKEAPDWYEYHFDTLSGINEAELTQDLIISSLNELGCKLISRKPFPVGETMTLRSPILQSVGIPECIVRVFECAEKSDEYFVVSVLFVGVKEESRQKIRIFCRNYWLQQRERKSAA